MSPKSNLVLVKDTRVLPQTKSGIVESVRQILDEPGQIESISIRDGQPIRVERWIPNNELLEEQPTLEGKVRQSEILELFNAEWSPYKTMYQMAQLLHEEGLYPVCWVIAPDSDLSDWLNAGLGETFASLLGHDVQRLGSLPSEALLLCGSPYRNSDVQDIGVVVKTTMEVSRAQTNQRHADRVGDYPRERGEAVRAAPRAPRGDGKQGWQPSNLVGSLLTGGRKVR